MRPIKFRGRKLPVDGGNFVYGDYRCSPAGEGIFEKNNYCYWRIQPDSVAQLVGYDKNGNEIYEGDTLIDTHGHEYIALLQDMVYWKQIDKVREVADIPKESRTMPLHFCSRFTPLTLKEDNQ